MHAACAAAASHTPASRPAPRAASHAPPFDSAGRAGLQSAAELRHLQGHDHDKHTWRYVRCALRACPGPQALSRAFPVHMTLAPPPPHALPRPGAHLAPHRMCMCAPPFDSAESKLLVRRQQAAHALHPAKLRVKIGSSVARGSHRATIFDHHNIESVGRRLLYDCIRPVLAPVKVLGVCVRKLLDTHVHTMMLFDFLLWA